MTIYNLGSINIDHIYRLDHLPRPGETLGALDYRLGLGGKGANQSVAAARAGSKVVHLGAMSDADNWVIEVLEGAGVATSGIARMAQTPTGHAIIMVEDGGENSIVLHGGANRALDPEQLAANLSEIGAGDILLMQNETSLQVMAATQAHATGARVVYSAAPFSIDALRAVLPYISVIALNELEAQELFAALGSDLPVDGLLITRGAEGAEYRDLRSGTTHEQAAFKVKAADTTGAGDCFAGWFAAGLDRGEDIPTALRHASAAAALQVTRQGAGNAMPERAEVMQFLGAQG
ncbi:ribokinase [Paracoccus aminophilus]|uniref:Ribokinase n=1 Tax=Paracoccus aminophilus JCM 7686 TaxID=1367847 RepID=S5XRP8_PARAH|nr:ribokinase [Paracoccus aminophilus]AGT10079.1 ribokinase [Paracoccus aminophilus JCM 7686]